MRHLLIIFSLFFALPAYGATPIPVASLQSGDLIRGQTFSSVYYYGEDGFRYVFPNDKTYFTWYSNFDKVKWLTDKDLASIQIGGNVTYKPGAKMIKINSDPKVYAVSSAGILRPITSETIATALYGNDWNKKIDDVQDGFFPNYKIGGKIEFASQFSISSETAGAKDINMDKNLKPAIMISVGDAGYNPPTTTIDVDRAVRFVNEGKTNQSATEWDGTWGSGTLKPGQHFTRYFRKKGTWTFYSIYTPKTAMTGALIVQ